MAVIRGPSVCRWFENCAENRKRYRANERGMHARQEGRSYLLYYGSRYYRGISRAREVAEEFSFGILIDAISREGEGERTRGREKKNPRLEKLDTRDISRVECGNLCFTFNKTKRGRRRATAMYYRASTCGSFLSSL